MNRKKIKTLEDLLEDTAFQKWATGTDDETAPFWEAWKKQDPEREAMVEKAIAIIRGIPFQITETPLEKRMIEAEWKKLHAHTVKRSPGLRSGPESKRLRVNPGIRRLRIAAGLALLILAGFLLEYFVLNPVIEYRTPYGQQLLVVLPDSSEVQLNANTTLTFRKRNPRKVRLDGEAFFDVRKKPASGANFMVLTNDLTVEVLGTAFNVIEKENKTEVVLEEGSIKLNLNRKFEPDLYMEPGDLVTFSAQEMQIVEKRQVQTNKVTSWKDGVLEFEDVALTEIMERIETIYGWKAVYYNESLKSRKISLGLPSEDLESALLILSKTMGMKIEQVDGEAKELLLR